MKIDVSHLKFDDRGLIPAIVQDYKTNQVLMLAYMNGESLARTVETGYTWFWSRSRQELWNKGATSGHTQRVLSITYDCDGDTLLVKVEQKGAACHTGSYSCFFNPLWNSGSGESCRSPKRTCPGAGPDVCLIQQKQLARTPDKPAQGQQDWILKKLGEECTRTLLASKNDSRDQVVYEMGDLWYHCLVLLAFHNITSEQMLAEMGGKKE